MESSQFLAALKPFHPVGMAGAWGGVSVEGSHVFLRDPLTEETTAGAALPGGASPADLYLKGRLFDLFPGEVWYTAWPWVGQVELCLTRLEREQSVDGMLTFRRERKPPSDALTWEANVRYGERGATWDIRAPLPPDHKFPGDIALRVQLAWMIYRALGERVPARGRIGGTFSGEVSNLFCAEYPFPQDDARLGDAVPFRPLPFVVGEMGDRPMHYLGRAYAWAWGGQGGEVVGG